MTHNPFSDVLRSVRLRGGVFYYVSCRDEWAAETPAMPELAMAVMPLAEHVLSYHLIVKDDSWAATTGEPPVRLRTGDIALFPHGDAHVLSSSPGSRAAGRQCLGGGDARRSETPGGGLPRGG